MTPRILIITPVYGMTDSASVALGYAMQREALLRLDGVTFQDPSLFYSDDLVRGRSRAACYAAEESDATHYLWWDSDVVPDDAVSLVVSMLDAGRSIVGAPYPVKRIKARYPYRLAGPDSGTVPVEVRDGCIQVDDMAMGFMLVEAEVVRTMIRHYRDDLWYSDTRPGHETRELVAIFAQMFGETMTDPSGKRFRTLDSEDFSFCRRARAIGYSVNMYVGPGAPVHHVGPHLFRGNIHDVGKTR